jgi:cell division septation protein DedD
VRNSISIPFLSPQANPAAGYRLGRFSRHHREHTFYAVLFAVVLHALVLGLAINYRSTVSRKPDLPNTEDTITSMAVIPPPSEKIRPEPTPAQESAAPIDTPVTTTAAAHQPASMAAPPAPTAEEWAFAAKYTLRNSKGYRYNWGQQVRSMMGTAIEGPDQGLVRFRVEIGPDGALSRLETLWTTSAAAEKLARKAIENMPRLPPTPTGKPLIFEKTISFTPFASDGPPTYKDDCLPDPPTFRNPFAWDGKSPQRRAEPEPVEPLDAQALEECLRQLPQDSIEAESARDQRLLDQWGSTRSGR